jgi:hypothetical protein
MNKTFGDPHGKGAFIYGTKDNAAMRRMQERDRKFDPQPQKPKIAGPSPVPVNYGWTNVRVGSGRGGGLLAGLAKLFVIGVIILALGGYFGSHQSGPAQRPSPSETAPRASHATQPYAMPPEGPPEDAGANVPDQQASTAVPTPANSSVLTAPSPTPQSTVPPIDSNDDPVGAGGFITPHEQVIKKAQVCVSENLIDHDSWENPPPGGKMEAFKNATAKVIVDVAGRDGIDEATQFRILDIFDSFDPATTNPHDLVAVRELSTHNPCPADTYETSLQVKSY